MTAPHLLVHDPKDTVGVVVVEGLKAGDTVWKYGQDIGKAVAAIGKGEHVNVHNLKTKRW